MIQESRRLIAQSLINYTKLATIKTSVFDDAGEFMFRRVKRPGCPLSEKELKTQLIDCASAIMKEVEFASSKRADILSLLRKSNISSIATALSNLLRYQP